MNSVLGRRARMESDALQSGPRKQNVTSDPFTLVGHHFGRAIYAFCNVRSLLTNGLEIWFDKIPLETLTNREQREHQVFQDLLKLCRGQELGSRLENASAEEAMLIADLLQKGANASRADDTKGLKSAVIDWVTIPGTHLTPHIDRKQKSPRGFNHEITGSLLCPGGLDWSDLDIQAKLRSGEMRIHGDQWLKFLYPDLAYDSDDPWKGLLKNKILVSAYKFVFTSPSSVDADETRATKAGNARIHGMNAVTPASLAYIATQVRFSLSSTSTFLRTDKVTDSQNFYVTLLETLQDIDEKEKVQNLISWWNKQIFPNSSPESYDAPVEGSVLERICQKRAEEKASRLTDAATNGSS